LEHQRQDLAKCFIEKQKPAGDLAPHVDCRVALRDGEVRAKELEDWDVGDRLTMGGTMAFVNRDAAGSSPSDEFQAQPALSDPWLSDDADDLALPFDHPVQSGLEGSHLGIAADKAREAASLGGLQSSENP